MVDEYSQKTNNSTYEPTAIERALFSRIVILVNRINNYL